MNPQKLPVFLTVDTEIWPYKPGWPEARLEEAERNLDRQFEHCILGKTQDGEFGLPYQMDLLNRLGLKATFFVDPLHSAAVGEKWLAETVGMISRAGHDVQMHAHTEWLSDAGDPALPGRYRQYIREFELPDQTRILRWARQRLERNGAKTITAFRAGNWGANLDTLRALRQIGIGIDSSYNKCYLGGACGIDAGPDLHQQCEVNGVEEFPVSVFLDYPGHLRPLHLAACSSAEFERVLLQAWRRNWRSLVIVWHGSELLRMDFDLAAGRALASPIVVRRFSRLCRFLADNRDRFETKFVAEAAPSTVGPEVAPVPLHSNPILTAGRILEQAIGNFL